MNARGILKSSAIYGFLNFLPLASRFILFPIFVNLLTPFDYSVLGLHASVVSLLVILISGGLDSAFSRYYFDYQSDPTELHKYYSSIFTSIILLGLTLGTGLVFFGDSIYDFGFSDPNYSFWPYGTYAFLFAFGTALNGIVLSYMRNGEQIIKYLTFVLMTFVLRIVLECCVIFFFEAGAELILMMRILGLYIPSIFFWKNVFKLGFFFNVKMIKNSLKYSFPILIYSILGFAYLNYDRIQVSNLISIEELSIYNAAFTIALVVEIAIQAIDYAIIPYVYKHYGRALHKDVDKLFKVIGLFSISLSGMIVGLTPIFFINFVPDYYHLSISLVPFLLVSSLLRFVYGSINKPLYYDESLRFMPLVSLIAGIILIGSNVFLIPKLGLMGACISVVLSRLSIVITNLVLVKKENAYRVRLGVTIPILILFSVSSCIISLIPFDLQIPFQAYYIVGLIFLILPLLFLRRRFLLQH